MIEIPDDDDEDAIATTSTTKTTDTIDEDSEDSNDDDEMPTSRRVLPTMRGVLKGADLEEEELQIEREQEEEEEKITLERGITIKQNKDGKTVFIFSGDQEDLAKVMSDKLRKKFELSKETELCDFKVIMRRKQQQQ